MTERTLSSSTTELQQVIRVALGGVMFLGGVGLLIVATASARRELLPIVAVAIVLSFVGAIFAWSARRIKEVKLADDVFLISTSGQEIAVPTTQLAQIREWRLSHTPSITMFFEPATSLGSRITVIPPIQVLSRSEFDSVADVLRAIVKRNHA